MLRWLTPEMGFVSRIFIANLWLFDWYFGSLAHVACFDVLRLVTNFILAASDASRTMLHTTTAVTMIDGSDLMVFLLFLIVSTGGTAQNVMPAKATAIVNHRILHTERVLDVIQHAKDVINDPRVNVRPLPGFVCLPEGFLKFLPLVLQLEPAPVSSSECPAFRAIHKSLMEVLPEAVVAPVR
jgi:carboxypeptidase PM20D1